MSTRRALAVAARVLRQLAHDRRSVVLLLAAPSILIGLFAWLYSGTDVFDNVGPPILALFPFVVMFLITSITTLRERRSGTLERLMSTPMRKADFVVGYGIAFSAAAAMQAVVTVAFAVYLCDLDVAGPLWQLALVCVATALLGTALGLLASAFAHTEFQAVQFMPIIVFPQFMLAGILMPRDQMPEALQVISAFLPLSYSVDAIDAVAQGESGGALWWPLLVVVACCVAAILLGSLTLRRRTD